MPHLVQLDHDGAALGLGLLGVHFGEALDPGLHRGRRHAEQLGGAVHRQPAQVQQHRLDLDPQRHATGRRVGEVQPAGLAPVALLAAHEPVLDVLPAPAPLAPQRHPLTPSAVPLPTHMGDLCGLETLQSRSPACTATTRPAPRSARSTASTRPRRAWCCTARSCASAAATASTPARSAPHSTRRPPTSAAAARWTSAPSAPAARSRTTRRLSTSITAPTASPRASSPCAPRCARPGRSWPAMATCWPTSTASARSGAASARGRGAGPRPTTTRTPATRWRPARSASARAREEEQAMRFPTLRRARFPLVLLALVAVLLVGLPPARAQLDQIAGPPPPAAQDQVQIYRDEPGTIAGRTEFPDKKLAVFVQPAGREWRTFRVVALRIIAGVLIVGTALALLAFYAWRGTIRIGHGRAGTTVPRFN